MKTKFLFPFLLFVPVMLRAQVNYSISSDVAYVTASRSASGNITIASSYNGKPVVSIGIEAFYFCANLTSVTIPNSVTNIDGGAFTGCISLTNVVIGTNVANIGNDVFSDCTNLTNMTIPQQRDEHRRLCV